MIREAFRALVGAIEERQVLALTTFCIQEVILLAVT
jgi:hypothetical protein